MTKLIDQPDTFCFDCVYMHHYKIKPCSHTICDTCLYEAVAEKVRLQQETFICPRCTDSEERRNRLREQRSQHVYQCQQNGTSIIDHQHSFNQTSKPESESFWPDGTESWHLHEIKPQRQSFVNKIGSEQLIIRQQIPTVNEKTQLVKHELKFEQHFLESTPKAGPVPQQAPKHLHVIVYASDQVRQFRKIPETTIKLRTSKSQQRQYESKCNGRSNNSLLSPHFSSTTRLRDRSRNRLLRLIDTCLTLVSLFLYSLLVRIGIVHTPAHLSDGVDGKSPTFESSFIVDTHLTTCSKQSLNDLTPYAKTIEMLRSLESLLIYVVT